MCTMKRVIGPDANGDDMAKPYHQVNIYSHLLGSTLFAYLPLYTYTQLYPRYSSANLADVLVFSAFFFGVAICFLLSAT